MTGEIQIEVPPTEIYIPTKLWYAFVDDSNRVINTIGSMFPITNLSCSGKGDLTVVEMGNITKPAWEILNKIVNSPYYDGVLDEIEGELIYYKLKADVKPMPGRDCDKIDGKYHTNSHSLTITARCLDENNVNVIDPSGELNTLNIKKLRLTKPTGLHSKLRLDSLTNPNSVDLEYDTHVICMSEPGEYTLRMTYNHQLKFQGNESAQLNFERYITICYSDS